MVFASGPRVLAIGDSITYGFGDATVIAQGAWRYYFAPLLAKYLKTVLHWTGTMQALGMEIAGQRMLGTSGRRIDEVLSTDSAQAALLLSRPDIVVIHLGTNDMTQLNSGTWVGGSIPISIANMSTLLDYIRTANPSAIVVVCKIIPNTSAGANSNIVTWNSSMATMVAARSDASFITTADCYSAFTANATWSSDYMYDGTHENSTGASIMGTTIANAFQALVSLPHRNFAQRRAGIKPHTNALRYTASTATTLGSGTTLDSTKPWAISFWMDMTRNLGSSSSNNGMICLKTDQATPFVFLTLAGGTSRGFEFGSSANFGRFFPNSNIYPNMYQKFSKGWHHFVVTFDGVDRTAVSSYKFYLDGNNIALTSGAGLGATSNVNEICRVISAGSAGTFDMADLKIWNDGSAMTAGQAMNLYFFPTRLPSGPTLTRNYSHNDGSGSTLTDSTGNQNGTIGTATWINTNVPTRNRTVASARTPAAARILAA